MKGALKLWDHVGDVSDKVHQVMVECLCHSSGPVAHLAQVTHLAGKFHLHCFLVCYSNCRCLMTQHLSGCL